MKVWRIDARSLHSGETLGPPVSKSDAQRALVLGHVLGEPRLGSLEGQREDQLPADVRVMRRGLETLARAAGTPVEIDCADGGAPFRLLLTQAALTPNAVVRFKGTPRLGERPHGALFQALRQGLGPAVLDLPKPNAPLWPLEVRGVNTAPEPVFRIAGNESSQYVSSLLLGAALLHRRDGRPWTVELLGEVASEGYLDLTVEWMKRAGFALERGPHSLTVNGWKKPERWPSTPGDWSSLGYLLSVGWATGSVITHVDEAAAHPDRAIVQRLHHAGLSVDSAGDQQIRVTGKAVRGIEGDAAAYPDLIPTLAALACVLPSPSRFTGVSILRVKESDRLAGVETLVRAVGGTTELRDDVLEVTPPLQRPTRFSLSSQDDHRMAMAAGTLAVLLRCELELEGPECVSKSFPAFWDQLRKVGVVTTPVEASSTP
jgi:3-phosphoshikimate 1-carboxyvinyltransferase